MRLAAILLSAAVLTSLAPAQTPAYVPFPNQTPEKQQAQCADIENRNVERMQQGLPAVHPWEELCNSAKTFDFTNKPEPERLKQIVMLLRIIVQLTDPQISADPEASTITLHTAPGKVEMVEWLLRKLDQPAFASGRGAESASSDELPVPRTEQDQPGKNDEIIRVFRLAHTGEQRGYQEILTSLHVIGDIIFAMGDAAKFTFVVRAPAEQMELAAYLIKALDVLPGSAAPGADFLYRAPARPFARQVPGADIAPPDVVRVFYPAHATSPKAIQQIENAIRTVVGVQRVFVDTSAAAIPVRGTAADIAAAAWLIQALDISVGGHATVAGGNRDLHVPSETSNDGATRVFYLGSTVKPEGLQSVLKELQLTWPALKSASCDAAVALVVRGAPDQMAQAEQSISDGFFIIN